MSQDLKQAFEAFLSIPVTEKARKEVTSKDSLPSWIMERVGFTDGAAVKRHFTEISPEMLTLRKKIMQEQALIPTGTGNTATLKSLTEEAFLLFTKEKAAEEALPGLVFEAWKAFYLRK